MQHSVASLKPRLRGVVHQKAFFASLVAGALLLIAASTPKSFIAAAVFAVSVSALLGVSALYHRHNWSPQARRWMRRLDHAMIFLLIAGTFTPFGLLVLDGALATVLLIVIWVGALAGILMELVWIDSPKWITAVVCMALGWVAIVAVPDLLHNIGPTGMALLGLGGILYTAGAIIYAMQRPNPMPGVFGYHEIFHVLVVIAVALQYSVVAFFVMQNPA